jgi:hypothetical protein
MYIFSICTIVVMEKNLQKRCRGAEYVFHFIADSKSFHIFVERFRFYYIFFLYLFLFYCLD